MLQASLESRQISPLERSRPRSLLLQWHVTNRCNLRCAHCYQNAYTGAELTFEELLRVLGQYEALLANLRSAAGTEPVHGHITVTGGEPFVRDDFMELLGRIAASRKSYSFAILTNGSFIDLRTARRLRALRPRFVQVSIEGTESTHDAIRGPGDFRRVLAALRLLKRFGVPTLVSFTAHRGNYREFAHVARLGSELGVSRVWADRLIPAGAGAVETLRPEEAREFFAIMAATREELNRRWFNRTEVAMHRALQFLSGGGTPYRCTAGEQLLTVMPDGEVYPCRRMPVSVGNVRKQALAQIHESHPLLRRLRRTEVSSGCEACADARRCRGGLKCLSYAASGDAFKRDPGCWMSGSGKTG